MKKKKFLPVVLACAMIICGMMSDSITMSAKADDQSTVSSSEVSESEKTDIESSNEAESHNSGSSETKNEEENGNIESDKTVNEDTSAKQENENTSAKPIMNMNRQPSNADITVIYLDGEKGDDSKDGASKENAVKTFSKAKEIASQNQKITTIYVTGKVNVNGEISLAGTKAIIMRAPEFGGYLFVAQDVTFKDIIIDGNQENVTANSVYSLIYAKGNVTIENGTLIQNNYSKSPNFSIGQGGGIEATGIFKMNGGVIQNNKARSGGGIYFTSAQATISAGEIKNNIAFYSVDSDGQPSGCGGGICIYEQSSVGSNVTIEKDATISNNKAGYAGGGIAVGTFSAGNSSSKLIMTGGKVNENSADRGGGGIFIQAGLIGKAGSADISGGQIINNQMIGKGKDQMAFGGGGIYVNGYSKKYEGLQNGQLNLTNAIIRNNKATLNGGGLAACPTTNTHIYLTEGAAICENDGNGGRDLYFLARNKYGIHSGRPEYTISNSMLGGKPYHWRYANNEEEVPLNVLKGLLAEDTELALNTDETADNAAFELGKVIISGNTSATRGGGIGSNGDINIGTPDTTEISITKKWKDVDMNAIPKSITIELYRSKHVDSLDKEYIGMETITPDKDGNWKLTFSNIPKFDKYGNPFIYDIKEKAIKGYTAEITGDQKGGFTVTNKYAPPEKPPVPPEKPPVPSKPSTPNTSDQNNMSISLIVLITASILTAYTLRKKHNL